MRPGHLTPIIRHVAVCCGQDVVCELQVNVCPTCGVTYDWAARRIRGRVVDADAVLAPVYEFPSGNRRAQ